jgi:hypothetical protein
MTKLCSTNTELLQKLATSVEATWLKPFLTTMLEVPIPCTVLKLVCRSWYAWITLQQSYKKRVVSHVQSWIKASAMTHMLVMKAMPEQSVESECDRLANDVDGWNAWITKPPCNDWKKVLSDVVVSKGCTAVIDGVFADAVTENAQPQDQCTPKTVDCSSCKGTLCDKHAASCKTCGVKVCGPPGTETCGQVCEICGAFVCTTCLVQLTRPPNYAPPAVPSDDECSECPVCGSAGMDVDFAVKYLAVKTR